ncbi:class I SAM-dependent methyltransferase [Humibacter sp. RRB41]|uniref:class I SAM-dependent methyltransferase n=1 Tax=Humibacter sp. RRB41 TaxID=2919946 RepID=UPI001FAA039C|nr:class I SAM-dependent methyltransferase [Humibacter sp. RRB41]
MSEQAGAEWDAEADHFDEAPDHGLRDPHVRGAWRELLIPLLPPPPARIADLACGTGSLSLLLAEAGHEVVGLDASERMLEHGRAKTRGLANATFVRGDAGHPALPSATFDVVLARHVLFLFDDPAAVIRAWARLLRPGGRLVLVEGSWSTGAGITAEECAAIVEASATGLVVVDLAARDELWGGRVDDERYLVVAEV